MRDMTTLSTIGTAFPGHSVAGTDSLVLGTVNAPFKQAIDVDALVSSLGTGNINSWLVHIATFFTDVSPKMVLQFAQIHGVLIAQLAKSYDLMKAATGMGSAALEAALVPLAYSS